jgi:hypothetical protein
MSKPNKIKNNASKKNKATATISSTERLQEMLQETERELETIQPKIDRLELQLQKLKELKLSKQKLITLKLSVQSILSNFSEQRMPDKNTELYDEIDKAKLNKLSLETIAKRPETKLITKPKNMLAPSVNNGAFLPEQAFIEADEILKRKQSINYDLFRAVVFSGGCASTEQIRQYLIENNIKQPASGESFENVPLTDISARINYLVRKGVVKPGERGTFLSCLGWTGSDPEAVLQE